MAWHEMNGVMAGISIEILIMSGNEMKYQQ
jgi:hypothetical protein